MNYCETFPIEPKLLSTGTQGWGQVHRNLYLLVLFTWASKMYFFLYPSTLQSTWYLKASTLQVHPDLFKKDIYYNLLFQSFSRPYNICDNINLKII